MFTTLKIMINARLAKMEERGASAVEYGLLIAGIAALIVVAVFALGPIVKRGLRGHLLPRSRTRQHRHRRRLLTLAVQSCVPGPLAPARRSSGGKAVAESPVVGRQCRVAKRITPPVVHVSAEPQQSSTPF